MSKQRTCYCPVCDGELWPTPCEKWYACPKGHTKLLRSEQCDSRNRAQREEDEKHHQDYLENRSRVMQLPMCGVEHRHPRQRKKDVWIVDGQDGKFVRVGFGKIDGCVHAIDPSNLYRLSKFVVSLRRLTDEEALKIILGMHDEPRRNVSQPDRQAHHAG